MHNCMMHIQLITQDCKFINYVVISFSWKPGPGKFSEQLLVRLAKQVSLISRGRLQNRKSAKLGTLI